MKPALAAALMIALSGVYTLLCCPQIYAAPAKSEHCAPGKPARAEHCKFSRKKNAETSKAATSVNVFERCALKLNVFVAKLEKTKLPQKTPVAVHHSFNFLEPVKLSSNAGLTVFSYRPRIIEQSGLNVKNCVFRI